MKIIAIIFFMFSPLAALAQESASDVMHDVWGHYYLPSGSEVITVQINDKGKFSTGQIAVNYEARSLFLVSGDKVCRNAKKTDGVFYGEKRYVKPRNKSKVKRKGGDLTAKVPRPSLVTYAMLNWLRAERDDVTYEYVDGQMDVIRAISSVKGDYPFVDFVLKRDEQTGIRYASTVRYYCDTDAVDPCLTQKHQEVRFLEFEGEQYMRPKSIALSGTDTEKVTISEVGDQSEIRFQSSSIKISKDDLRNGGVSCGK